MAHLSPEQLLDIAEGSRQDATSHLGSCRECQRQLADMQAVMAAISGTVGGDVPEPSPLFWEHFSIRVHDAIASEPSRRGRFAGWLPDLSGRWNLVAGLSAAATAAIIVTVMLTSRPVEPPAALSTAVTTTEVSVTADTSAAVDDPSFGVVSDLAGDMDVDTAMAAGLASAGSANHAVLHMTGAELMELERLLQAQASEGRKS